MPGLGLAVVEPALSPERAGSDLVGELRTLVAHRELLVSWTAREVKVRYKQSLLGIAWAILQPLALMIVFSVVFTVFVRVPSDGVPYPIFSYTALLPWTFLASAVGFGSMSVLANMSLVTKVSLPREILPLASVGAAGVDSVVAAVVFVGMAAWYGVRPSVAWLALPVLILVELLLAVGIVLVASATTVRFRDVRFVVPLAMQLWMYATPIIYPVSVVPERYRSVYLLNPMATVVEGFRAIILRGKVPDLAPLAVALCLSGAVCLLGYAYFKRFEASFADIL